jgi:ParB family transcriptional regulator, chromosome partitioning protein
MSRKLLDNILEEFNEVGSGNDPALLTLVADLQSQVKRLESSATSVALDIEKISRSPYQPRKHFDSVRQAELNASVNLYGVTQNIIVREISEGFYELIAGERRLIAARASNFSTIPAKILNLSDRDARAFALTENLQRENLNIYEETRAVVILIGVHLEIDSIDEVKATIIDLAKKMRFPNKKRDNAISIDQNLLVVQSLVADHLKGMNLVSFAKNRLPLMDIPDDLTVAIEGGLSYLKALAISKVAEIEVRADLIKTVNDDNFGLRDVRKLIKGWEDDKNKDNQIVSQSDESVNLSKQKSRFASISRKVKSMKDFKSIDEMEELLNRMEVLIS